MKIVRFQFSTTPSKISSPPSDIPNTNTPSQVSTPSTKYSIPNHKYITPFGKKYKAEGKSRALVFNKRIYLSPVPVLLKVSE